MTYDDRLRRMADSIISGVIVKHTFDNKRTLFRVQIPSTFLRKVKSLPLRGKLFTPGGEGGIRTLESFDTLHDFESCAFSHSATSPRQNRLRFYACKLSLRAPSLHRFFLQIKLLRTFDLFAIQDELA